MVQSRTGLAEVWRDVSGLVSWGWMWIGSHRVGGPLVVREGVAGKHPSELPVGVGGTVSAWELGSANQIQYGGIHAEMRQ